MQHNNYAHYWCTRVIAHLIRRGVSDFFIAPGSRSTPITAAIVRNKEAQVYQGIDERSLAFMALGFAKKKQRIAAIVVTSGTAVANLHPAVVEAYLSQIPILVITADRPFELRGCGSNQTIFQTHIFSQHSNKNFDLAPPSPRVSLANTLALFDDAVRACLVGTRGPVHINIQLREPLANCAEDMAPTENHLHNARLSLNATFDQLGTSTEVLDEIASMVGDRDGIIIVGEMHPNTGQDSIVRFAEHMQWPIFADVSSNLRFKNHELVLHHFELALRNQKFVSQLVDKALIRFGARIVSKQFWQMVSKGSSAPRVHISQSFERIDPSGRFEMVIAPKLNDALQAMMQKISARSETQETRRLKKYYRCIKEHVDLFLEQNSDNEAFYAARLIANISTATNLFVSSSMPIRDLDQFARFSSVNIDIFANRGASGIDGVTSSAVGMVRADDKPGIVLIGDIAFLHDTNGLMLAHDTKSPLLIVVINNGGGRIFHFLPIARERDVVTPYCDTPHSITISDLCRAHKIPHKTVGTAEEFDAHLRDFYQSPQATVLEVRVDPQSNVKCHKEMYQKIAELGVGE